MTTSIDKIRKSLKNSSLIEEKDMTKKYKNDAMAAIHETVEALQKVGVIDKKTMRHFDDACLIPVLPLSPLQIKKFERKNT